MPEKSPPILTPEDHEPDSAVVTGLDQAVWRRLSESTTAEEFCLNWLVMQTRMIGGVNCGVVVLERPDSGSLTPVAVWPRGFRSPDKFTGLVERLLTERKGVVLAGETGEDPASSEDPPLQLGYPVRVGDKLYGVAALEIGPRPQIQLQAAMRQLQWGIAWLQNWCLRQTTEPSSRIATRLTTALELAAIALEEERSKAAATACVTELATRLNCDRVSIGFVKGEQVRVYALSHSAQFGKEMNLIRAIGMAMDESVDQGAVMLYPPTEEGSRHVLHSHEQLVRTHGDRAICTIPFMAHDGSALGALTLERSGASPFDADTVEMCDSVAALVGPILEEKRKNDRLVIGKIGEALATQVRRLVGPRHTVRKMIVGGLLLLALFFTFATGQYRVTAKTVLEGQIQRAIAAPYRGFIAAAEVRAGDLVREGQVMCTLDDRDLRLEHSRWSSEREQYLLEHRRSMADGELAAMNVMSKKMSQAEAQINLLNEQIERARIIAPFDGIVVSGDLSQSLGAPVDVGQTLFEIAPLDAYRVILQVDEGEIGDIEVEQAGELILTAFPQERMGFSVTRITPVSVSEEGSNYFRVEAALEQTGPRLRPGMEGFGKISIDRRKLIWIWTHDLNDWVRLWAWSWLP